MLIFSIPATVSALTTFTADREHWALARAQRSS
jgi:hypothetical protein